MEQSTGPEPQVRLSTLTTLRVGGPAHTVLTPSEPAQLIAAVREAWASGEDWLLLGGGSNVVVADEGFDGIVIRVVTRGVERIFPKSDVGRLAGDGVMGRAGDADVARPVRLRVQAGEPWDALVAHAVEQGWSGIEALSGIPGSVGAAPIQNIGAYGQELSSSLIAIEFLDYLSGELLVIPAAELGLGYRTSAIKQGRQGLVVSVELQLSETPGESAALSRPVGYAQLASALGVEVGARAPLAEVRARVLALRASKGMLLSESDPDSVSVGSFFTNPIVSENFAKDLPKDMPRWPGETMLALAPEPGEKDPSTQGGLQHAVGVADYGSGVKLSAAWLIEHSGITRGFSLPGSDAAISSKHTLAIVNTGEATAAQVVELARFVQSRVLNEFGVILQPEPALIGVQL